MIIESIKKYKWEGKKALIVEDDPSAAFLLSEILHHTSMQVEIVNSGLDAVEKCKIDPGIDVVLLDLQIPGISGFEAATLIKQIRADLPIIAQSAYALIEEKERAIRNVAQTRQELEDSSARFENLKERIVGQGEKRKQAIIAEAHRESKMLFDNAKRKIDSQVRQAQRALQSEMIDIAVNLARERLPGVVTEKDNQKFLDQFLKSMAG